MRRHIALFTILLLMTLTAFLIGGVLPVVAQEHIEVLPAGSLPRIADPVPALWAMSGYEIARVRVTVDGLTPVMRTQVWDARLVEIVWRWQDLSLDWNRVEVIGGSVVIKMIGGDYHHFVVHRYLLMQVTLQDAEAEGTSVHDLALKWGASARRTLDRVFPQSRFGA